MFLVLGLGVPFRLLARSHMMQGWASLPDQRRWAAKNKTCFFGNKKDVRIELMGRCLLLCPFRGKGVTSFGLVSE